MVLVLRFLDTKIYLNAFLVLNLDLSDPTISRVNDSIENDLTLLIFMDKSVLNGASNSRFDAYASRVVQILITFDESN